MKVGIVGGGIIGYCSAYFLQKSGHEVTIFEKSKDQDSPSYWNAGMVVPSHFIPLSSPGVISKGLRWMFKSDSPFYIKPRLDVDLIKWLWNFKKHATTKHVEYSVNILRDLNQASNRLFDQIIEENHLETTKNKGLLMIYNTEKGAREEKTIAEKANELGVKANLLNLNGLAEIDPAVRYNAKGAVYYPNDAFLSPNEFMRELESVLIGIGVTIMKGEEVENFSIQSKRISRVHTSSKEIEIDQLVLCSGINSFLLGRKLGINLPMQGGKGYSVTIPKPSTLPGICSILTEAKVTVTPMNADLRLAGTMEISGMDLTIRKNRVNGYLRSVSEYIPEYEYKNLQNYDVWTGLRPCSPDGLPYIGNTRKFENLVVCTGHSMMGFSMGPISGKLVSELINDSEPSIELSKLKPERFK